VCQFNSFAHLVTNISSFEVDLKNFIATQLSLRRTLSARRKFVTEGESDFYESRAPQRIICHSKGPLIILRSNDSNPSPFCIIKLTIRHKHNPILVYNPSRNLQLAICQVIIIIIEILRVMNSNVCLSRFGRE
jgi:hypothetical protein